jgi:hypothetical protein
MGFMAEFTGKSVEQVIGLTVKGLGYTVQGIG